MWTPCVKCFAPTIGVSAEPAKRRIICHVLLVPPDRNIRENVAGLPFHKHLVAHNLGPKPESLSRGFARLKDHGVRAVPGGIEIGAPGALNAPVGDAPDIRYRETA